MRLEHRTPIGDARAPHALLGWETEKPKNICLTPIPYSLFPFLSSPPAAPRTETRFPPPANSKLQSIRHEQPGSRVQSLSPSRCPCLCPHSFCRDRTSRISAANPLRQYRDRCPPQ